MSGPSRSGRTGDLATGHFSDAKVVRIFGDVPDEFERVVIGPALHSATWEQSGPAAVLGANNDFGQFAQQNPSST